MIKFLLKCFLKTTFSILAAFLLFIISLVVLFRIEPAKQTLTKAILETIEYKTGWKIEIQNYDGVLPFQISLNGLHISSQGDPYLVIDHFNAALSPMAFLHGSLAFTQFELDGLKTFELTHQSSNEKSRIILPFRKISFRHLNLKHLDIYGAFEDLPLLNITGSAKIYPFQSYFSSKFAIDHEKLEAAPIELSFSLRKEGKGFEWLVSFEEGIDGFLHQSGKIEIPIPLKLTASGGSETPKVEFQLQTDLSRLELPNIKGIGQHILLNGNLEVTKDQKILVSELDGKFLDGTLSFSGSLIYEIANNFIDGKLAFSPFKFPEYGTITTSLMFRGKLDSPALTLNSISPKMTLGSVTINQFHSQTVCNYSSDIWEGEWIAGGNLENLPITMSCHSSFKQEEAINFSKVVITCPSATLYGNLDIDAKNWQVGGKLEGTIQNLDRIGESLELPLQGSLGFLANIEKGNLKVSIQGKDIVYDDIKSEKLSIEAKLKNIWNDYKGEFALNAYHMSWKDIHWEEFSIGTALNRTKNTWPFSLTATGNKKDKSDLNVSGKWHLEEKDFFVHLGVLTGHLFDVPYELTSPANIYALHDEIRTSVMSLSIGDGNARLEAKIQPDDINCMIDMKNLPTSLFNHLLPEALGLNGNVSCFLRLAGPANDIQGSIAIKGKDLQLYDEFFAKLPISQGKIEAVLNDNFLTFEGEIYDSPNPVIFEGEVPIALSLYPFKFGLPQNERMQVHLKTSGELAPFLELFVTDTTNVEGTLNLEVIIGGTPPQPIVEGRASIKNGIFESLNTGAVLNNIEMNLIGNDKKLILESFAGFDGSGGKVTATGHILLDTHTPFELDVNIDKATLMRLDYASMSMSGNVIFSGDMNKGKVTGDLLVDHAEMEIPEQMPVQMKTVDVTFINEEKKENPLQGEKQKQPWPIELALNFNVPSNVFVTGKNLTSEWKGDFAFTGTTFEPLIHGTLQIIEGEYSFNGESFVSTQGSVHFAGDPGAKTTLYIVGDHQVDNIKIQAILKGAIGDPTLTFRSNPPMSQKEILAWILFGHGIDEITPFQVAKLSQSVFTLTGGSDNPDILTRLRNKMGIDRIDISGTESGGINELSLRLGKYISQGIYVSLNKSINAEANQVAIEANLTRHFKVQAEVGDNAEGKMSLKWAKDY